MKVKRKSLISLCISMISLFLIGFICWGISSSSFERTYKRIVISRNYIEVNSFTFSEYSEDGFVNDYTISNIAYLDINVSFDLEGMKKFINHKSFDFESKLKYQSLKSNYFDIINTSFKEVIILDNYDSNVNYEVKNNEINSSFLINNNLENIESLNITLRYIFDVSEYIKDSSFKDNVYSLMINKGIPFDFKITIG